MQIKFAYNLDVTTGDKTDIGMPQASLLTAGDDLGGQMRITTHGNYR